MTKKHYEAIAKALKNHKPNDSWLNKHNQYVLTCNDLANYFQTDNKNFNREKFLQACGIE